MAKKPDYSSTFKQLLDAAEKPLNLDAVVAEFGVSETTIKKHLRLFIKDNPEYLKKLIGFLPDVSSVIAMAEKQLNTATNKNNLYEINKKCKEIVDALVLPVYEDFLRQGLKDSIDASDKLTIPFSSLLSFLAEEYEDFLVERGNSLVSIAGRMNEEILIKGLESSGLIKESDFVRKGQDSDADLKVFYKPKSGDIQTLYIEVKSYRARERFLRGLVRVQGSGVRVAGT